MALYACLAIGSVGLMALRGFQPVDALFGFFIALGFVPAAIAIRDAFTP